MDDRGVGGGRKEGREVVNNNIPKFRGGRECDNGGVE